VTVAIIDTGVDTLHPDLQANMNLSASKNFVEPGQKPDDDFGHGTHVAGIVAAVGDNTLGASGVAFGCKIAAIRVLGVDGTGTTWSTVQAIDWAVEKGCKVLNMSLGSPDASPLEAEAIARATAAGSLVVAAAGNEAADGNYLEYPACYPGVLSVAAVDRDEKRATFSNYNSWVGVAAPGVDIFSTIPTKMSPTSPYGFLSGTSMASPMAAGAAALLYSQNPRLTPAQVVDRLKRSAKDLTPPGDTLAGYDVFFGAGLIQADKALGR
jgi:subtilisin family serine protease